ncbi:MAG: methyl-accepting chemotaxis protein [Spirochaetaceae bacterium]|nr:methyl-accepting chemotaxis protein [Spirochaetaceae bacterium]
MKSLKTRFFLFFIALSSVVSFGVGITMYSQYASYIKYSLEDTLRSVATMIDKKYPVIGDKEYFVKNANDNSEELWDLVREMRDIEEFFNLTFIYVLTKEADGFHFILDTDYLNDGSFEAFYSLYEDMPDEVLVAYETRKFQVVKEPYTDEWGTFLSAYLPIIRNNVVVGVLGLDYDIAFVQSLYKKAWIALGLSLLFAALLAALFAIRISSYLIKPIKKIVTIAGALANMDFNVEIDKTRKDEIGSLADALIVIRDNFKKAINDLNSHLSRLTGLSETLDSAMTRSTDGLTVINQNMDSVQKQSDLQLESVKNTSDSVETIVQNINLLNKAVQTQSDNISESSASIEEMVANIQSIRSVVNNVSKTTNKLSQSSELGQKKMLQLVDKLKQVSKQSESLQKANMTISNITSQTNLLAMNAAIEAAHAGEAGRGFSVVAGEIRKLAEMSDKESISISNEIKKMEEIIKEMIMVSDETSKSIDLMFTEANTMGSSFETVNNAVEEQAMGGKQILESLKTIGEMTQELRSESGEIQKVSGHIYKDIEKLKSTSKQVNESVQGVRVANQSIAVVLSDAHKITSEISV